MKTQKAEDTMSNLMEFCKTTAQQIMNEVIEQDHVYEFTTCRSIPVECITRVKSLLSTEEFMIGEILFENDIFSEITFRTVNKVDNDNKIISCKIYTNYKAFRRETNRETNGSSSSSYLNI